MFAETTKTRAAGVQLRVEAEAADGSARSSVVEGRSHVTSIKLSLIDSPLSSSLSRSRNLSVLLSTFGLTPSGPSVHY